MKTKDAEKFEVIKDVHAAMKQLPDDKQNYIKGIMQGILICQQNKRRKTDDDVA